MVLQTEGETRLEVFEKKGAEENIKREELTGGWRELRYQERRSFIICVPSSAVRVMIKRD